MKLAEVFLATDSAMGAQRIMSDCRRLPDDEAFRPAELAERFEICSRAVSTQSLALQKAGLAIILKHKLWVGSPKAIAKLKAKYEIRASRKDG